MGADCKSVGLCLRRFESFTCHCLSELSLCPQILPVTRAQALFAGCHLRSDHSPIPGGRDDPRGETLRSRAYLRRPRCPHVPSQLDTDPSTAPDRAPLVLASLIIVAAVANLNLSVANVALPAIGKAFDSSQTALNLIAVGYSLGLAASVLYLGAVGDRSRAQAAAASSASLLSVPACLLAAYAPNDERARAWPGSSAGSRPAWPTRPPWR